MAPTPTNISTKSEPEMVKNGTLASPAMARASKRLAGAGRADQQRAFRNLAAEPLEFVRIFQELDDLLEIFLRLIDAGDILEGDAAMAFGEKLRLGLAEAHGLAAARLHLADEEHPHADQEQRRQPVEQRIGQEGIARCAGLALNVDVLLAQRLDEVGIDEGA